MRMKSLLSSNGAARSNDVLTLVHPSMANVIVESSPMSSQHTPKAVGNPPKAGVGTGLAPSCLP